jgi:hypothetical protein
MPKFAEIVKPLTALIRKDNKFEWGDTQQTAFDKLKGILCSGEVLVNPDFSKPFIFTTDTSKVAVAAVLSQKHDGIGRPVAFASRQLNQAERNYCASCLQWFGTPNTFPVTCMAAGSS